MAKEQMPFSILAVEDNSFFRDITRSLLKGYNFTFASNGVEAIYKFQQQEPTLVFLDIELPDINGFDVLSRILKINPQAKVVMLSGNSDKESVRNAIRLGAQGYITKPVSREKMELYIKRFSPQNSA